MKKLATKVVGCVLAAMMLVQPVSTVVGSDVTTQVQASALATAYIKSSVYLRKSASTKSAILTTLKKNQKVTVVSTSVVGWYKVKVGGKTGYVGRNYVTYTKPKTTTTTTAKKTTTTTAKKTTTTTAKKTTTTTASKVNTSSVSAKTKGQQVVSYARQFVGRPYVYGGTSLTSGIDCSGFTQAIYGHFGYSLPRTSRLQRNVGTKIDSLSQAQAGDLICYEGHVAIYMGNNKIVHAANSRRGIVEGDSANYTSIVTIRRIVK